MIVLAALFVGWLSESPMGPEVDSVMDGTLCSVGALRNNPEGYHWPLDRIHRLVDDTDVIVRAVAVDARIDPEDPNGIWGQVRFQATETIRGVVGEAELEFFGRLVDQDDFNPGDVPYRIVRRAGQRGDCFAREYRAGREYLFLLRARNGNLTPYWVPLAPTNEQIRDETDPWLEWVRARVE